MALKKKKKKKRKKISPENKTLLIETIVIFLVVFSFASVLVVLSSTKNYTVLFHSNGGNQIPSQTVRDSSSPKKPEDPKREGYLFLGWYQDGELYSFEEEVHKDISLEAKWKKLEVAVESIALDVSTITLEPNEQYPLKVTVLPEDANEKQVFWNSSNPSVVTVDETGVITALKDGIGTVQATTRDGAFQASVDVTVKTPVPGITLEEGAVSLEVGYTYDIRASVYPKTYVGHLLYKTNSPILSVDEKGTVKALAKGGGTITVYTEDGKYQAILKVTVTEKALTSISILGMDSLPLGATATLKLVTEPEGIPVSVIWKSENTSIVTVDENGRVVGVGIGKTVITATTKDGKKVAKHEMTVREIQSH